MLHLGCRPVLMQICSPFLQLLGPLPCMRGTSVSATASGQVRKSHSSKIRHTQQGPTIPEACFETWVAANQISYVSTPSQDRFEAPEVLSAEDTLAAPVDKKLVRRLHYSVSQALIRELLEQQVVQWSPQQRLFLCKPRVENSLLQASPAAPSHSESPGQLQVVPCRPSIARGASNSAIRAAASRCASLKLPPLQMPALDVSCSEADALIWQLAQLDGINGSSLVVLLSADSAALGLWRDGELVRHKVLSGYTVRKGQGTSQLKQMRNSQGRPSVGSAIRARETQRFFRSVAIRLAEWSADLKDCKHLFFSGQVRAWNEVFACTHPGCLLTRQDERWRKLPLSIRRPKYDDLERALVYLTYGELVLNPSDRNEGSLFR